MSYEEVRDSKRRGGRGEGGTLCSSVCGDPPCCRSSVNICALCRSSNLGGVKGGEESELLCGSVVFTTWSNFSASNDKIADIPHQPLVSFRIVLCCFVPMFVVSFRIVSSGVMTVRAFGHRFGAISHRVVPFRAVSFRFVSFRFLCSHRLFFV